jgi:hypothetical protein
MAQKITRQPGVRYTASEFGQRQVYMLGSIQGTSISDLQTKIDNLFKNVVRKEEGNLSIESGRSVQAFVSYSAIEDPHYTQTYVPFELEFTTTEPFFKGVQQVMNLTVTSGIEDHQYQTQISGTAFAEPEVTYTAPAGSGDTTTAGIHISYAQTGETVTWSGTGATNYAQYGDVIKFDFPNQIIVRNDTNEEPAGVFPRWEPGTADFTITFSGVAVGGTLQFAYQPRYF